MGESKIKKLNGGDGEGRPIWHGLNIFQRMHEMAKELGGLGKDKKAPNVIGNFAFHSHNAVTDAVQAACERWNVLMVPSIFGAEEKEVDYGGKVGVANKSVVHLDVTFMCPDLKPSTNNSQGDVGFATTVKGFGSGVDKRDLASGKAYSYALKMALIKTFKLDREGGGVVDNEADTGLDF